MFGVSELSKAEAAGLYPNATAEVVDEVATGIWLIHVLQVYTSAMVAIAAWDWIVCLASEYQRIWKREWSLVKCLYLWNRYYGLFAFGINLWLFNGEISVERCKTLHYLIAATCMWSTLGSEAILAIRTYAFLGKDRKIALILVAMLFIETGYLLFVSIAGVHQTPLVFGTVGPCTASDAPGKHVVMGFWLCPVVFDLLCSIMTGMKAVQLKRLGVKSDIVKTFVREGLFYFLAVATINVLNAAFMFQSNANIQNINSFLALILSQVLCCRLVLNLRAPDHGQTSHSTSSVQMHVPRPVHPATTASRHGFSIPLNTFQRSVADQDEDYGGVKINVEVAQMSK